MEHVLHINCLIIQGLGVYTRFSMILFLDWVLILSLFLWAISFKCYKYPCVI